MRFNPDYYGTYWELDFFDRKAECILLYCDKETHAVDNRHYIFIFRLTDFDDAGLNYVSQYGDISNSMEEFPTIKIPEGSPCLKRLKSMAPIELTEVEYDI